MTSKNQFENIKLKSKPEKKILNIVSSNKPEETALSEQEKIESLKSLIEEFKSQINKLNIEIAYRYDTVEFDDVLPHVTTTIIGVLSAFFAITAGAEKIDVSQQMNDLIHGISAPIATFMLGTSFLQTLDVPLSKDERMRREIGKLKKAKAKAEYIIKMFESKTASQEEPQPNQ